MIAAFQQWWLGLSRRERIATIVAAALVIVALTYLVAIEPAWRTRVRLGAVLPQLRAQAAEMDALGAEARRLATRTPVPDSAEQRKSALGKLAAENNVPLGQVREADDQSLSLSIKRADAGALLAWLKEATSQLSLRIVVIRIARVGPGLVDADVTFVPGGTK